MAETSGSLLHGLRRWRAISQDDLVRLSGVAKATIVGIELDRIEPHPATLRKLAVALDVPVEKMSPLPWCQCR